MIGLLGAFCRECERKESAESRGVPAWHCEEQEWIVIGGRWRGLSDIGFIILFSVGALPGVVYGLENLMAKYYSLAFYLELVGFLLRLWASIYTWRNAIVRRHISDGVFKYVEGKLAFRLKKHKPMTWLIC
jgi:hypothetical protein